MKPLSFVIVISVLLLALNADAKTDVSGSLQQLKSNEDNAKSNKKQYEENADIASKNIVEVTAAIKQLRDQKNQLSGNAQNLEKNRAILDKMKEKLQDYSKDETAQLKKEDMEISALRATLTKLETNKKQHEENLETYKQKIADVEKEKADWDAQKQAFVAIQKELDSKEAKAMAEREKWLDKRKGYRGEASKWEKESEVAEQNRVKFDKLKN